MAACESGRIVKILKLLGLTGAGLALAVLGAGQIGLFAGAPPARTGVADGRLQPPSNTPNSVSSQALLYPDHPQRSYAAMEPLQFSGTGSAALQRLATVVLALEGTVIVEQRPDYIRAESTTRLMGFKDDLEFWLDAPAKVIHFRSASRMGAKDFGVNRARMETIRARFGA